MNLIAWHCAEFKVTAADRASQVASQSFDAFGWEVWPDALYDMIQRVTADYDRPVIEITENGCSYADGPDPNGVIRDARRIDYCRG